MVSHTKGKYIKAKRMNPKKAIVRIGVICIAFYVIYLFVNQQIGMQSNLKVQVDYKAKIADALLKQDNLKQEASKIGTDEYLEQMAREKLGMVKANERVFIDATQSK